MNDLFNRMLAGDTLCVPTISSFAGGAYDLFLPGASVPSPHACLAAGTVLRVLFPFMGLVRARHALTLRFYGVSPCGMVFCRPNLCAT